MAWLLKLGVAGKSARVHPGSCSPCHRLTNTFDKSSYRSLTKDTASVRFK